MKFVVLLAMGLLGCNEEAYRAYHAKVKACQDSGGYWLSTRDDHAVCLEPHHPK